MAYLKMELEDQGTFATYDLPEEEAIDFVTLGMLNANALDGVLPFQLLQVDGKRSFRYNVNDRTTLDVFFSNGVTAMQIFDIFQNVAETVVNAKEYMIEEHSFLFDLQTVFVDAEGRGCLICLPVKKYLGQTMQAFCNTIIQSVDESNLSGRKLFAELQECLEEPDFNAETFAKRLQQVKLKRLVSGEEENVVLKRAERVSAQTDQSNGTPSLLHGAEWDDSAEGGWGKTVFMPPQRKEKEPESVLPAIAKEMQQMGKPLDKTVFMPVAEQKANQQFQSAEGPIILHNREGILPDLGDGTVVLANGNTEDVFRGEEATQCLMNREYARGYLVRASTGERIAITKTEFRIGKSHRETDYCVEGNPAVSRHHAKIIQRGDFFWLIDTDSKNRTYVDQKVIEINHEVRLSHATQIRFADEDFTFFIEEASSCHE